MNAEIIFSLKENNLELIILKRVIIYFNMLLGVGNA